MLIRLFEDDLEVAMTTLLGTKQENREPVKTFVKRLRRVSPLPKQHDPRNIGVNMMLESPNSTPRTDEDSGMSHMEATVAAW